MPSSPEHYDINPSPVERLLFVRTCVRESACEPSQEVEGRRPQANSQRLPLVSVPLEWGYLRSPERRGLGFFVKIWPLTDLSHGRVNR